MKYWRKVDITVSSAYKRTKSFKYTASSISKSSVIDVRPLTFRSFKNCSRSFKGRLHNLSIQCQLDIFDKTVKPILLYGCETWGFGKNDIIERVHLKFCKLLLHVKTSMSFDQYAIIRTLMSMSIGYRPNSP
jgi:hypothetical protein